MHKSRNVTVQLHLFCCGGEFTTTDQRSSPMCATTLCHCWFLDTQREFKTSILQYWWAAATASKEIHHVWQGRTSPPREQNFDRVPNRTSSTWRLSLRVHLSNIHHAFCQFSFQGAKLCRVPRIPRLCRKSFTWRVCLTTWRDQERTERMWQRDCQCLMLNK